jgi:hypothetical protein
VLLLPLLELELLELLELLLAQVCALARRNVLLALLYRRL